MNLQKEASILIHLDFLSICNFTLAIPREFSREETDFINCVAWEKKAETIEKYVKKGHRFGVIGRIQIDSKDNSHFTRIIVEKIDFLENAKSSQEPENTDDDSFPF